jgi:branched-chain amino acid aminotransferase
VRDGHVRYAGRHVRRLRRDAELVGLGTLDEALAERALKELAQAAFPSSEGIVSLEAGPDAAGALRVLGTTRPLGPERPTWEALTAPFPHEGPTRFAGAKLSLRGRLEQAAVFARAGGADEALLLDEILWLVEGTRTNLFVVSEEGELLTPPLARGAVAGIARELALERIDAAQSGDVSHETLSRAREVVCVNAVRGARPVVRLDGRDVGGGRPGPWAARLARTLEED